MAEQKKIGWEVVKVLIAHNRRSKAHYGEITISAEKRGSPLPIMSTVSSLTRKQTQKTELRKYE